MNVEVTDATNTVEVTGLQSVVVSGAVAQVVISDVGVSGPGVPAGGIPGQLLVKDSTSDYDASWQNDPLYPSVPSGTFMSSPSRLFAGRPAVGRVHFIPVLIRGTMTFDAIGYLQWTSDVGLGSVFRFGLYADNGYKRPGELVTEFGTIAGGTTGYKLLSINTTLTTGLWHFCLATQGVQTNNIGVGEAMPMWIQNVYAPINDVRGPAFQGYFLTGVTGALPADASNAVGEQNITGARIYLRIA